MRGETQWVDVDSQTIDSIMSIMEKLAWLVWVPKLIKGPKSSSWKWLMTRHLDDGVQLRHQVQDLVNGSP